MIYTWILTPNEHQDYAYYEKPRNYKPQLQQWILITDIFK